MRILGISPIHDSSVAIINDGALEVFFKEERLSGKKRDKLPFKSIFTALNCAKGPIDYVAICSPDSTHQYNQFLEVLLGKLLGCEIIHYSHEHHFCHANLAFYNSGFSEALTVVIDRNGSQTNHLREAESVFVCKYPNTFEPIYKSFPGWQESTQGEFKFKYLPDKAKNYLKFISEYVGLDYEIISTGPNREQTIFDE